MSVPDTPPRRLLVEEFEIDLRSHELRRNGHKIKLQALPFQILIELVQHPGDVITRDDIRQKQWPGDTFVDFEHGINTAVNKLREAFGDSPETPQYIQTLPRLGYRFIARVNAEPNGNAVEIDAGNARIQIAAYSTLSATQSTIAQALPETGLPPSPRRWLRVAVAITALVLLVSGGVLYWWFHPRTPVVVAIHQLTRDGRAKSARDGPKTDGTRLYFDESSGGKFHTAQVSTKGEDVSYLDLPMIESPFVHGISYDGLQLEVFDEPIDVSRSTFWLVPLPDGSPRRIKGTYLWAELLQGNKEIVYWGNQLQQHW